ncbi:MAG: type-F conjugative transfer system pilin assembly protein TrbC [Legionellales bacterium]
MPIFYGAKEIAAQVSALLILMCANAYAVDTSVLSALAKSITERIHNSQIQSSIQSHNINETQKQILKMQNGEAKLFIAVSFSMPEKLILDYLQQAKEFNTWVVVQGFKDNSMPAMLETLAKWDKKADISRLLIDPNIFKQYQITSVPSIVLTTDTYPCDNQKCIANSFDKVIGSIRLQHALKIMAERGDLHETAKAWKTK